MSTTKSNRKDTYISNLTSDSLCVSPVFSRPWIWTPFFIQFPQSSIKFQPVFCGAGWTGWGWSVDCQRYFRLCLVSRVSDSLIPLCPALHTSPRVVLTLCLSDWIKLNLQPRRWMRQCSISAAQIKSGLGFPQTLSPQHSISFRVKRRGYKIVCEREIV